MKSTEIKKDSIQSKELNSITSDLQKLYSERIERFMALVGLSYALKNSTRIIQKNNASRNFKYLETIQRK